MTLNAKIKLATLVALASLLMSGGARADILKREHCPEGCLMCEGKLETQSYQKKCLKCDIGFYEYIGSCHYCPDKCLLCSSDRVCLKCQRFYSPEGETCSISYLDLAVRFLEIVIICSIFYVCFSTISKYRKQQEKYEIEKEIKLLSSGIEFRRNTLGVEKMKKKKETRTRKSVKKDKHIDESLGDVALDARSLDDSAIGGLMQQ